MSSPPLGAWFGGWRGGDSAQHGGTVRLGVGVLGMAVTLKVINDLSDDGPSVHNPPASPYFLGRGSEMLLPVL